MNEINQQEVATVCELSEQEVGEVSGGSWAGAAIGGMAMISAGPVGMIGGAIIGAMLM